MQNINLSENGAASLTAGFSFFVIRIDPFFAYMPFRNLVFIKDPLIHHAAIAALSHGSTSISVKSTIYVTAHSNINTSIISEVMTGIISEDLTLANRFAVLIDFLIILL